jgi:hypothetical protein
LNHQSGHKAGVAGIYNRSACGKEVKAALALWADHLRALVEGGERKILQFPPNASWCILLSVSEGTIITAGK